MKHSLCLSALLVVSLALVGCQKPISPYGDGELAPEGHNLEYAETEVKPVDTEFGPSVESLDSNSGNDILTGFAAGNDPNSEAYMRSHGRSSAEMVPVYFAFDSAHIEGDQVPRMEQNAEYLRNNPNTRLVVQGNCDERGTTEYNIALGERRAINARNYLVELGIDTLRLRTVSYGEERPLFLDQDEESWALNRRDDFILE